MGLLINVDNGGTLTDFCVIGEKSVIRTKSITTPYDLSKCLFEGLKKVSTQLFGEEDLRRLMLCTERIRYSTTQGTNALVELKGPRLGLLLIGLDQSKLVGEAAVGQMFKALVGPRIEHMVGGLEEADLDAAATRAVNALASAGASRLVVVAAGAGGRDEEMRLRRVLLKRFPPHLLGALPVLYSYQLAVDANDVRRAWTALINAFLHPAMERFLYSAEQRLLECKTRKPLLIFRNDGGAARIARTCAIKTYSSGPRGGGEAARALSAHYGMHQLIGVDIGGTTTDVSVVERGTLREHERGEIGGAAVSLPLAQIESVGVGGSSIIKVHDGKLAVGPESVGGAPGPACFGLGGTEATITDALLVGGLLDPNTFFGGELRIDLARAQSVIDERIATPLSKSRETAVGLVERAWTDQVAQAIRGCVNAGPDSAILAFGGAGPLLMCGVANRLRVSRILIPRLAAVLSAFGVGFSEISHDIDVPLSSPDEDGIAQARAEARQRAQRAMFSEGYEIDDCCLEEWLVVGEKVTPLAAGTRHPIANDGDQAYLGIRLRVRRELNRPKLSGSFGCGRPKASASGGRRVLWEGQWQEWPVYRVAEQAEGSEGHGPAVIEEDFYTCRLEPGWSFEMDDTGDILLTHKR